MNAAATPYYEIPNCPTYGHVVVPMEPLLTGVQKKAWVLPGDYVEYWQPRDVASALDVDYDTTISRVIAMAQEEEDGPTLHALTTALVLLANLRDQIDFPFPRATASTTPDGGIHVYWERPGRTLVLAVPPRQDAAGYIYHEDATGHAALRDTSPQTLVRWLTWFAYA